MNQEILDLLDELGAESAEEGKPWKRYKVMIPTYVGNPKIGPPYVLLKDDGGWRISTVEEAFAYLDFELEDHPDNFTPRANTPHNEL